MHRRRRVQPELQFLQYFFLHVDELLGGIFIRCDISVLICVLLFIILLRPLIKHTVEKNKIGW